MYRIRNVKSLEKIVSFVCMAAKRYELNLHESMRLLLTNMRWNIYPDMPIQEFENLCGTLDSVFFPTGNFRSHDGAKFSVSSLLHLAQYADKYAFRRRLYDDEFYNEGKKVYLSVFHQKNKKVEDNEEQKLSPHCQVVPLVESYFYGGTCKSDKYELSASEEEAFIEKELKPFIYALIQQSYASDLTAQNPLSPDQCADISNIVYIVVKAYQEGTLHEIVENELFDNVNLFKTEDLNREPNAADILVELLEQYDIVGYTEEEYNECYIKVMRAIPSDASVPKRIRMMRENLTDYILQGNFKDQFKPAAYKEGDLVISLEDLKEFSLDCIRVYEVDSRNIKIDASDPVNKEIDIVYCLEEKRVLGEEEDNGQGAKQKCFVSENTLVSWEQAKPFIDMTLESYSFLKDKLGKTLQVYRGM